MTKILIETNLPLPTAESLKPGDNATMWHEGSKSFYEVTVNKVTTPEAALGHPLENGPDWHGATVHSGPLVEISPGHLSRVSIVLDKYVPDPSAQCSCGDAHRAGAVNWFCLKHGPMKVD
jgi:hypothetical protein